MDFSFSAETLMWLALLVLMHPAPSALMIHCRHLPPAMLSMASQKACSSLMVVLIPLICKCLAVMFIGVFMCLKCQLLTGSSFPESSLLFPVQSFLWCPFCPESQFLPITLCCSIPSINASDAQHAPITSGWNPKGLSCLLICFLIGCQ